MKEEWDSVDGQGWEGTEGYENFRSSPTVPEMSVTAAPVAPRSGVGVGVGDVFTTSLPALGLGGF